MRDEGGAMARWRASGGIPGGRRDTFAALAFLAPNFLGFALFVAFPILFSLALVFTNWSLKPAIETRFVGLANVWTLLGLRHAPGAAGGAGALAVFLASHALFFSGVAASLVALARKWPGVRAAGAVLAVYGALLVALGACGAVSTGWLLVGLTSLIASVFFILDDDEAWAGRGIAGPLLLALGTAAIRLSRGAFSAAWEPLDPLFWQYLYNTLYLMFLIPLQIAGSLGLALLLNRPLVRAAAPKRRAATALFAATASAGALVCWTGGNPDIAVLWGTFWGIAALGTGLGPVAFRTLFFLPSFTAGVAIMLLWKQMFNPDFGPLNEALRLLIGTLNKLPLIEIQAELPKWIHDPHWSKPSLILMGFWTLVGGANMLIYLAGLANIPGELYEAAQIDGATRWQTFKSVTWPQLAPTTFFIVIMTMIAGLQGGFEQARVMTKGGPVGSTKTLAYYIYERAFEELSLGYASTIAWVLFVLIFGLTALNWKFGNRYVNE